MRLSLGAFLAASHFFLSTSGQCQDVPQLSLPISCRPGHNCFIQHYVDLAPGPERQDYRCGTATYDGHDGVDFRLLSIAAAKEGVAVLAAAPGVVRGTRDDMIDAIAREAGRSNIQGRECGNGVLIDHGGGWQSQYCHLRSGSVRVVQGAQVSRGDRLGDVGWSGLADFSHLHFVVRKNGRTIDPFRGENPEHKCSQTVPNTGLWDSTTARTLHYANGEIINSGFTSQAPTIIQLEHDHAGSPLPTRQSAQLLIFARLTNVRSGDQVTFRMTGPAGFKLDAIAPPIDRDQAVHIAYAGKKRVAEQWPTGQYEATVELIRDKATLSRRVTTHEIR